MTYFALNVQDENLDSMEWSHANFDLQPAHG